METKLNQISFEEEEKEGYRARTIKNASADATIALATNFDNIEIHDFI